jgi:hypothetical protein
MRAMCSYSPIVFAIYTDLLVYPRFDHVGAWLIFELVFLFAFLLTVSGRSPARICVLHRQGEILEATTNKR